MTSEGFAWSQRLHIVQLPRRHPTDMGSFSYVSHYGLKPGLVLSVDCHMAGTAKHAVHAAGQMDPDRLDRSGQEAQVPMPADVNQVRAVASMLSCR